MLRDFFFKNFGFGTFFFQEFRDLGFFCFKNFDPRIVSLKNFKSRPNIFFLPLANPNFFFFFFLFFFFFKNFGLEFFVRNFCTQNISFGDLFVRIFGFDFFFSAQNFFLRIWAQSFLTRILAEDFSGNNFRLRDFFLSRISGFRIFFLISGFGIFFFFKNFGLRDFYVLRIFKFGIFLFQKF